MSNYYVYYYIRSYTTKAGPKGSPYYVGRGKGHRIHSPTHSVPVPQDLANRFIIAEGLTFEQSCQIERLHIRLWGRRDTGTGILLNQTDGGEGAANRLVSEQTREKLRAAYRRRTPETIKLAIDRSRERVKSPEVRAKKKASIARTHKTEEFRKKARLIGLVVQNDPETNKKRSTSLLKAYQSDPEIRKKVADAATRTWNDPDVRNRRIECIRNVTSSPEFRAKQSESKKGKCVWNNGIKAVRSKECPGPGWVRGFLPKYNKI